jgi:hypothetical protein
MHSIHFHLKRILHFILKFILGLRDRARERASDRTERMHSYSLYNGDPIAPSSGTTKVPLISSAHKGGMGLSGLMPSPRRMPTRLSSIRLDWSSATQYSKHYCSSCNDALMRALRLHSL